MFDLDVFSDILNIHVSSSVAEEEKKKDQTERNKQYHQNSE